MKCCFLGLMGDDCARWCSSFHAVRGLKKSAFLPGDWRNRFLAELCDVGYAPPLNVWSYVLFLCPELPLEDCNASEKIGPFIGEDASARGYWKSEYAEEEEVSESISPEEEGRCRRSRSSSFGSISTRVRSCQPFFALNWARARRFWSFLAI